MTEKSLTSMPKLSWSDAIRYLLIGVVGFLCYAYVNPHKASEVTRLGTVIPVAVGLTFGCIAFYVYDALLLPLIHRFKDLVGDSDITYRVRLKQKFPAFELSCSEAEFVYVCLLRDKVGWKDVPGLDILTSGIHLLYMSFLLALVLGGYAVIFGPGTKGAILLIVSAVFACAGFKLDRRAERLETSLLYDLDLDDENIQKALNNAFPNRKHSIAAPQDQDPTN